MIIPSSRPSVEALGQPIAWIYNPALVSATLACSPGSIDANTVSTVTFTGSGTTWLSVGAPTFTPAGVSGVSAGAVTVISDTSATVPVTTGSNTGVITWTDSTTSETCTQMVQFAGYPRQVVVRWAEQYYKEDWV